MSGLTLGLISHVLAGLSPFIVARIIARTGLLPATAAIYSVGAALLAIALVAPALRQPWRRETRALASPALRPLFAGSVIGFLIAGVAYYHGLTESARVAEYVFLTRLDWLVQAPAALLLLGEPWTRRGLAGGALALAGGLLLAWSGAIGTSGLIFAAVYIAASLLGYLCATPLTTRRGLDGALALTIWRHWINTIGFVALAAAAGAGVPGPLAPGTLALMLVSACVLIGLFLSRFAALTRMPLWMLSAQAPIQALVAVAASLLSEGRLPLPSAIAIGCIVAGEWLVMARPPGATAA